MRDLPILTFRMNGTSSTAQCRSVLPFLEECSEVVARNADIMGELIGARVAELDAGISARISIMSDGIQLRLIRKGRQVVLHTPDPYRRGSSSRHEEGDFARTSLAMIDMTLRTLRADLIPEEERDALDDRRRLLSHAIAMAVVAANAKPLEDVGVSPPTITRDALVLHANSGDMDATVPTTEEHLDWMPIRCVGLSVSTTTSGVSIDVKDHVGWMKVDVSSDPVSVLRGIAESIGLPPAPPPVIPDEEWEVVY